MQEMTLSRRILHLTDQQAYWQCRCVAESEDGTISHSTSNPYCSRDGHLHNNRVLFLPNAIPEGNLNRIWWTWVIDYSRRQFTHREDRLYACAGITKYFERLAGPKSLVLGL